MLEHEPNMASVYIALISSVSTLLSTVFLAWMNRETKKTVEKAHEETQATTVKLHEENKVEAEQIKEALVVSNIVSDNKLEKIVENTDKAQTARLRIAANLTRRIAVLTKDPECLAAADAAEKELAEHEAALALEGK